MKTIVVNLLGGAGAGKSTLAADLFKTLKKKGYNCELIPEFAKELVYQENFKALDNQLYVFGNQYLRMDILRDKVDILICDSPLILSIFYNNYQTVRKFAVPKSIFEDLVVYCYSTFDNLNYFIKRDHEYKREGRYQDEQQARKEEKVIEEMVNNLNIGCLHMLSSESCLERIIEDVEKRYKHFQEMQKKGIEIERKFIVDEIPEDLDILKSEMMIQAYIGKNGHEVRIRNIDNKKFVLTEKYGSGIQRDEYEKEIDEKTFFDLLDGVNGRVVEKLRNYCPLGNGYMAELDVYRNKYDNFGRRLMTVEVEFPTLEDAQKFIAPDWFGKEVTGVKEYKNSSLAGRVKVA